MAKSAGRGTLAAMTTTFDTTTTTRVARNGEVELWTEMQGTDGSAVLLMMGSGSQAIQWEPAFVEPLVRAGHRVVRFDWRDVGLSTWGDFRARPYTPLDLIGDAVAVLDAWDLPSAHLVGFSMGGGLGQLLAGLYAGRALSLTSLSAPCMGGDVPALPEDPETFLRFCSRQPTDEHELETWFVEQNRLVAGSAVDFDEDDWRTRVRGWLARGNNRRCGHMAALRRQAETGGALGGTDVCRALRAHIRIPTLAIHGDEDLIVMPAHADEMVATTPDARAVHLPGRGHDLWLDPTGEITCLIIDHVAAAERV